MTRIIRKPYHKWTAKEKSNLRRCSNVGDICKVAARMELTYVTVYSMWKHLLREQIDRIAEFDYSKIRPLESLFTRCPVCGGSTGVDENAYCHSCLSLWNRISLKPMEGLHAHDSW